jgi:hypothetical protein
MVEYMADHANDNSLITPKGMLRAALEHVEHPDCQKYNRAILILLEDDDDGLYDYHFMMSNIRYSECIALLTAMTHKLARELNGDE